MSSIIIGVVSRVRGTLLQNNATAKYCTVSILCAAARNKHSPVFRPWTKIAVFKIFVTRYLDSANVCYKSIMCKTSHARQLLTLAFMKILWLIWTFSECNILSRLTFKDFTGVEENLKTWLFLLDVLCKMHLVCLPLYLSRDLIIWEYAVALSLEVLREIFSPTIILASQFWKWRVNRKFIL